MATKNSIPSRILMNWIILGVVIVLVIGLIIFLNKTKEHFTDLGAANGAMYEQKLFGDNQFLYNRDAVDKQIPLNGGIDISTFFNDSVKQPDVDLQFNLDRNYNNFFGTDPTAKYRGLDANCKTITRPIDLSRSDAAVQCGWWYISEPTIASTAAVGTPDEPMFPDSLPKMGQWIWDLSKAQMLEEMKNCNRIKLCSSVGLDAFKGVCGWCEHKNYSVPILNGVEKYPNATFACGETVLVDSSTCVVATPPRINASDGTLCGLYGTPSPDNTRRIYTKEDCDSLLGTYATNGDCLSKSGLVLNDECRGLNKPISITTAPVVQKIANATITSKTPPTTNDRTLLPLSQLGLFGGAVQMTDTSQYLPGLQTVDDICTINQFGKLPIACIQGLAVSLGYSDGGAILRILRNPGVAFTVNEEMAMNILLSDGLVFPSGGILNSSDKTSVGNFLNELYGKMLSGSSGLVKAAAGIFVNGDSSGFDPCNPNNPPIMINGVSQPLSTSVWCLQRAFRQAGCQATGNAYPTPDKMGSYSTFSLNSILQMFSSMFNNMSASNFAVQDKAVKDCLGLQFSRDASVPLEYTETQNADIGEDSIACYSQSPDFCAQKCSSDPTCLSYTYSSDGSQCCINSTRTNIIPSGGTTLMVKNSGYPNGDIPDYVGCYKDTPQHLLSVKGPGIKDGNLQPCIDFAKANQLGVMGLQNGSECYFGTSADPFTSLGAGESSQCKRYGGSMTNQVYNVPLPAPVIADTPQGPETIYQGCFKDCQGNRALPNNLTMNMTTGNNMEECKDLAIKAGANVFGLQNGKECWAGTNADYDWQGSAGNCPVNGDACTQQVYTLPGYKKPALPTNINYMGCFTDTGNRAVENYRGDVSYSGRGIDGKTACMNKAIQNGDNIFAVQCSGPPTGNCNAPGVAQCFTGQDSEYDQFGANSNCTNMGDAWTNQVYTIGNLEQPVPFSGQYNTIPNMDRGGADIGCIGNQGDSPCKIACDTDPKCVAWNSIAGGHCCWKNKKSPKGPNSAVIFHEKIGKGKKSGPILFENPTLKQNNLIGVISGATPNYIISFDVTPLGTAGQGDYASIIRFTFASNGAYDDANDFQAPGIFFRTGTTKLAINIGVVNGDYSRFISDPLPLNIPTSVVINCQGVTSTISINGVVKYNTNTPRHLPNGRPLYVFAGDAKFPSANATVKNLTYTIL